MTPGQRGRRIGRVMIAVAVGVSVALPAFLTVAAPGSTTPMFSDPPGGVEALHVAGFIGGIVGLAWMIRIHRADPEPDQHAWRYRSKR